MSFISTREHQLFIQQFQSFLDNYTNNGSVASSDENLQLINADIDKLQQIFDTYKDRVSQLQYLAIQYKTVLKRTRVNMRRQQIERNDMEASVKIKDIL